MCGIGVDYSNENVSNNRVRGAYGRALKNFVQLLNEEPEEEKALDHATDMEMLALLIEQYERHKLRMPSASPIDIIKYRMSQLDLGQKDMQPLLGSASKVSEVLNLRRQLSLPMIRRLNSSLGISALTLIREYMDDDAS
jgi:HTH-type transcriptional regulator / antitoxin HigA